MSIDEDDAQEESESQKIKSSKNVLNKLLNGLEPNKLKES
jgi:hypothetical protein